MSMKNSYFLPLLFISIVAWGTSTAQVTLRFNNLAGTAKLILDSATYKTPAGDPFTVSLLQYYISNIELFKSNGEKYIVPKTASFFLVKQAVDSSREITLTVPDGAYAAISFLVGVDSLTSTLGIEERKGVLDPGKDMAASESMYWTWNSGYIFFKMEGASPAIPADRTGFRQFEFHIGGFGGYNSPTINNIRRVTVNLPAKESLQARSDKKAVVNIKFDVLRVFQAVWDLDVKKHHHIMLTPISSQVADNYARGFLFESTEYQNK